jgi:hypothetical protein
MQEPEIQKRASKNGAMPRFMKTDATQIQLFLKWAWSDPISQALLAVPHRRSRTFGVNYRIG